MAEQWPTVGKNKATRSFGIKCFTIIRRSAQHSIFDRQVISLLALLVPSIGSHG